MRHLSLCRLLRTLCFALLVAVTPGAWAQVNGPACDTYTNKTKDNGVGFTNIVQGVYVVGSTVYAATNGGGLSISTDGGSSFTTTFTNDGLGSASVNDVYAVGRTVYAATSDGLSISTDGGSTFTNRTDANGLGSNNVQGVYVVGRTVYAATAGDGSGLEGLYISTDGGSNFTRANGLAYSTSVFDVYVVGSTIYAATNRGLSISTDGGSSFTTKTTANGLGTNSLNGVYVVGSTVYAATFYGVSISTDGGSSFTTKTTANGLGDNTVYGVYALGRTVYAATLGGLSISTNGGSSFTNYTTANGLGSSWVNGVYALDGKVYAATHDGLSFCPVDPPVLNGFTASPPRLVTTGSTILSADVTGGKTPYSYVFSGPGVISQATNRNTASVSGLSVGVQTFTVVVSDATSPISQTTTGTVSVTVTAPVPGGPACDYYATKTDANGLGSNNVQGVYVVGSTVYAATLGGLSISTNEGSSFTTKTTANGLGSNSVVGVYVVGSTVYAATLGGLSISTNGGSSFTNRTDANGLGSNTVNGVYVVGSTVYAATLGGLSISTNGGSSFTTKTTANGLGSNNVVGVYVVGSTVYAATLGGLSISTDGGGSFTNKTPFGLLYNATLGVYVVGSTVYVATAGSGLIFSTDGGSTFTQKTTANGLGSNRVNGVYALGSTVYAATAGGLSISTNGGSSFTNNTANGLGSNTVSGVYALSSKLYAATSGGLSFCPAAVPPLVLNGFTASPPKLVTTGSTSLSADVTGGKTPYSYVFSGPGVISQATNSNTASLTVLGVGVQTFTVVVSDAISQTMTGTVSVTVTAPVTGSGPACDTYTNKTTANGLGENYVFGVYVVGSTVYAATDGGLSISTNGGSTFTTKTTANGLGSNRVNGVFALGSTVYAATAGGLSISTNGGSSFTNRTDANGLGSNFVQGVYVVGSTIYAATYGGGVSISTNGGSSFTNKTTANGLGENYVNGVFALGSTVYAATDGGLSISTDGGSSFTNKTTANGLGDNKVYGVYAVSSTVYAATGGGLSISTDGGSSFTNKTTANGLGDNTVYGVYALGSTVYAATNGFALPPAISGGGVSISTNEGISFTTKTTANGLGSNTVLGVYALSSKLYAATSGGLSFCLAEVSPLVLNDFTVSPASVCVGNEVTFTATVANVTGSYGYTLTNGASTTTGSSSNPAFSQPLTASGSGLQTFTLTVSSQDQVATATTSLTVNAPPSPTLISSGTLTCAQTSVTLTASGGGTYRFSNGAAQLNGGNTARVTTAGLYSVTVTGTNGCSAVASTPVQSNTASVTLSTPTVSTATLGQAFSQPFTATGGTSPYSYSVASGSLPAGLSLATTGVLSGTPTQSGSFTLTVRGRDANGCSDLSDPYRLTVSASASVIRYVKAGGAGDRSGGSWADASDDLQSQIDFAGAQQVWVAQGTYKPGGTANTDRTLSFAMRNGVSILGGFAASGAPTLAQRNPGSFTTVLSGDIGTIGSNSDNSLHVINNGGLNATAMLDGFVIRDGNSDSNYASGMNNYSSSPIVTNCSFQNNVGYYGAGMSNIVNSNPTVTNCSFQNNSSTAYGGGMYNDESSPVLTNCSFQGNSAYQGGGMSNNGSSGRPSLTNCSFQNNSATQGGAIINYFNTVSLTNCVVFGNGGDNTIPNGFGSITASYCLFETSVTGYIDGGNNLTTSTSPFMSPTDARLNGCSPAINAGNNAAYTAKGGPTTDLAGNPRFFNNGVIDMGAYEYQAAPTAITVTAPSVSTATVGVAFSQNFTATGGTSPYSYSVASGSLPAGLSLATTGVISGTPTQTGSLTLTVLGWDANGCSGISAAYVLTVSEPASVMLTGLAATPTTVCAGSPVTFTATVGNVTGSYSYTITNGLSSSLTGSASGTTFTQSLIATGSGEQSFTLTVSANGRSATSVAPVTVNALPTAGLVNNGPLTCAQTSVTLTASGGTAYSFTGPGGAGLPGSGSTRVVSGPGNYSVSVADASGCANTASTTVTSTTATVSITSPAVSTATVGIPFSQAFIASGGVSPYSFGVGSGNLPASLSLSTTGVLSGTPTQPDTYTLLVQASDVNGCTGSGTTYSLTVNPPPVITRLTVLSRDPENGNLNTNTLKPYLQLQNDGDSPIPYGELTVRYWLTVENPVPLRFDINYAQMGNDKVQLTYVPISPARQGATGYIEFRFDASAGSLGAGSTAVVQDLVNKQDYSQFFQGDDYSYANTGNFVANPRITAYRNGVLVYGQEPGPVTGGGPSALSLTASASPTTLLTTGTTQLQAFVMGGTSPFTYSYSGPGTISGSGSTVTVSNLPAGVQTFTVTVTDATAPMNQTVTATVTVTVTAPPANQPPVASPNANQTATVGVPFTYTANAFTDETPNSLTYTASFNPANNLSFNPATRVIQGTPMNTGVSSVTITATDPGGLSASTSFTITVLPHPVGTPTTLTVLSRDPDNGQLNTNTLKPYLQLQNDGDSPIPYGELTVRYWLTVENPVPLRFDINYAQMGNDKVQLTYVPISPARQGATGYIEFRFDASAGSLGAGSTAVIQDLVNKQDYSQFFQGDDYSYANTGNFVANPRITAYRNGVLVYGQEPPSGARLGGETTDAPWTVTVLGNPVKEQVTVVIGGAEGQEVALLLSDVSGHLVATRRVVVASASHQEVFDVQRQGTGLLLLEVVSGGQRRTLKVLKE